MMVVNLTELDLNFSKEKSEDPDHCDEEICEHWAEILGVAMCFVSVFTSIGMASFLTIFKRRMRLSIMILLSLAAVLFTICTLILEQVITFQTLGSLKLSLYLLLLPAMTLSLSSSPIAFELSV